MAGGCHVNTLGSEALVAVYNFLDGPNWSGVLNAVLNAEDEEENITAVLRTVAGHGLCELCFHQLGGHVELPWLMRKYDFIHKPEVHNVSRRRQRRTEPQP